MTEEHTWLEETLEEAKLNHWCVRPSCTTCGSRHFRDTYLRRAARVAGIEVADHQDGRQILESLSLEERAGMFEALVAAARHIESKWQFTDALDTILQDLDPPFIKWGVVAVLRDLLEGTPAGNELISLEKERQSYIAMQAARAAYESPEAVKQRRLERQRETEEWVAAQLKEKAERDASRQEFLNTLAAMSDSERLLLLATKEKSFPLEMIPDELVPAGDPSNSLNAKQCEQLIRIIGKRKRLWRRLRKRIEVQR